MNFHQIPPELKALKQWVNWKYRETPSGKPTKVPLNPKSGRPASVTDPETWSSFEDACAAVAAGYADGIGFVLTEEDEYCFIDLDDPKGDPRTIERHRNIVDQFDTYAEWSPSLQGVHLICKAKIPHGIKQTEFATEVYSSGRYMTMTGNLYHPEPREIAQRQGLVDVLFDQLGGNDSFDTGVDEEPTQDDNAIINACATGPSGELFLKLWSGDISEHNNDHSAADQALCNIIAARTNSREQCGRIFLRSQLGQRDKAQKRADYVPRTVAKAFDQKIQMANIEALIASNNGELAAAPVVQEPEVVVPSQVFPPGLLGEIATFIYQSSPRPVPEIALAGAIGLLAGICGRYYNVSATGLNMYVLLLAETGRGKEAIANGISKLMSEVIGHDAPNAPTPIGVPAAKAFLGPAEIQSAPALIKTLVARPQFVSVLGEFGILLRQLSDERAPPVQQGLKRALLDIYGKSGAGNVAREMAYSKKEDTTEIIQSPAFSFVGESTPSTFYESLEEAMIAQGLLPRILTIEYLGPRVPRNRSAFLIMPDPGLLQRLRNICAVVLENQNKPERKNIAYTAEAEAELDAFDLFCDQQLNAGHKQVVNELWNRAHLKVLKLAGLCAVSANPHVPVISIEAVEWAKSYVIADVQRMTRKFETGEVGSQNSDDRQFRAVVNQVKKYLLIRYSELPASYGVPEKAHASNVIPYRYIQRSLVNTAAFRGPKATEEIKRTLKAMCETGVLYKVTDPEAAKKYGIGGDLYQVIDMNGF